MVNFCKDYLNMRRIKPAVIRTSEGNITNLAALKAGDFSRDDSVGKGVEIKETGFI